VLSPRGGSFRSPAKHCARRDASVSGRAPSREPEVEEQQVLLTRESATALPDRFCELLDSLEYFLCIVALALETVA